MRWPLGNEVFHPEGDRLADPRAAAGPDRGRGGGANAHSFGIWDFEKGSAGPLGGGSWAFARLPPFPFHRSAPGVVAVGVRPSPPLGWTGKSGCISRSCWLIIGDGFSTQNGGVLSVCPRRSLGRAAPAVLYHEWYPFYVAEVGNTSQ